MAGEITDDLLKSLHKPLKAWYKGAPDPEGEGLMLAKRLGRFPMFFQDLRKWEGFKEAYKLYLASIESAEKKEADREIAAKRKRSRWHDLEGAAAKAAAAAEVETEQEEKPKKRRSRWAREPSKDVEVTFKTLPSGLKIPAFLTPEKQIEFLLKLRLDRCNQQLANVEHIAANAANDPNRSPSPEPIYNSNGKRINKRIDRMRGKLIHERTSIVAELIKCNPALKGMAPKIKRKLYIPQKQFPKYNFIGIVLGPRGMTQKRMEQETETKISIRGKGSVKEGKRRNHTPDMDDDLHVMITGSSVEKVEQCERMIANLLMPTADEDNEHKQRQLMELARINGTLREAPRADAGDQWDASRAFRANIKCTICGDPSHTARDCKHKQTAEEEKKMDEEYKDFMSGLYGGSSSTAKSEAAPMAADQSLKLAAARRGAAATGGAAGATAAGATSAAPVTSQAPPGARPPGGAPQQQQQQQQQRQQMTQQQMHQQLAQMTAQWTQYYMQQGYPEGHARAYAQQYAQQAMYAQQYGTQAGGYGQQQQQQQQQQQARVPSRPPPGVPSGPPPS